MNILKILEMWPFQLFLWMCEYLVKRSKVVLNIIIIIIKLHSELFNAEFTQLFWALTVELELQKIITESKTNIFIKTILIDFNFNRVVMSNG